MNDFSIYCNAIDKSDILNIHRYLWIMNNRRFRLIKSNKDGLFEGSVF